MASEENKLTPEIRFHLIRKMERHKVVALAGPSLLRHERTFLEFHNVSGLILFRRNIESLSQLRELIAMVNEAFPEEQLPALIMVDHEGDFVAELRGLIGVPPSLLAIAATGDIDLAREVAHETGLQMKKLGVNAVLAPVADCYTEAASPVTGLRTFGVDPERVGAFVAATTEGFQSAGILTCAKHFPGHGPTNEDSHETLPEVKKPLEEIAASDIIPFRRAVAAGVDMVMMAHVAYPMGRDELIPASFDRRIVHGLLRDEVGFDGVVITDALEMAGARWYAANRDGTMGGGFERALIAGCDLLLHTRPIPEQVKLDADADPVMSQSVMETIIKTLEKVVDRSRVDDKLAEAAKENEALGNILSILQASIERVNRLRGRITGIEGAGAAATNNSKVIKLGAFPTVPAVYRRVAQESVAAAQGYPWPSDGIPHRITIVPVQWAPGETIGRHDLDSFIEVLGKHFPLLETTPVVTGFTTGSGGESIPRFERTGGRTVVDASRYGGGAPPDSEGFDFEAEELAIVFSARGAPPEEFMLGLHTFAEQNTPAFGLVVGWPITDWVPEGTPVLITLGASPQGGSAVAEILSGNAEPAGNLDGLIPGR